MPPGAVDSAGDGRGGASKGCYHAGGLAVDGSAPFFVEPGGNLSQAWVNCRRAASGGPSRLRHYHQTDVSVDRVPRVHAIAVRSPHPRLVVLPVRPTAERTDVVTGDQPAELVLGAAFGIDFVVAAVGATVRCVANRVGIIVQVRIGQGSLAGEKTGNLSSRCGKVTTALDVAA